MEHINILFNQYGYIVLFVALMLELIALPISGEVLMTYCGFLIFQGNISWTISIIMATLGTITGITISYWIGYTLGSKFFNRYGSYIHMGPNKIEMASKWFQRYGNKLLVIAYFIPGVRHFTGYFSGITKDSFKEFAKYSYIGAFIWTSTFITLGKVLGSNWDKFHEFIKKYLLIASFILSVIIIMVYFYRIHKKEILQFTMKIINVSINTFHSLGKIKFAIAMLAVIFILLSIFITALIQDYLANEFTEFNIVVFFLIRASFTEEWKPFMKLFGFLLSYKVLILLWVSIFSWILVKGRNKWLEIRFLLIVVLGGELFKIILTHTFHDLGPLGSNLIGNIKDTFPSEQCLMSVVVYGFSAFIVIRHLKKTWIRIIIISIATTILLFTGLNSIFFEIAYPSDVLAGYAFGSIWLSLNIILLEVFRIWPKM